MEYPNSKPGDYVVGSYNEMGRVIKAGKVQGDEEQINDIQEMILAHGERTGGKTLSTKASVVQPKIKKKAKKIEVEAPEIDKPLWKDYELSDRQQTRVEMPPSKKFIYLFNKLGKIKLAVEEVLECDQAYCLVFRSEDDLIFTPNPGETLSMINLQGDEVAVYYANSLFTWTDGRKQLLILFKKDE